MIDNSPLANDPSPFPDLRQVRFARGFVTVLLSTLVLLLVCTCTPMDSILRRSSWPP